MSPQIILADDNRRFRQGLKSFLEREGFQVVGEASDGREAVRLAGSHQPDVAILDLAMPILNGLAATVDIRKESPNTRTILLTMHNDGPYVLTALRVGVRGYVLKSQMADDLVSAIQEVVQGRIYLSPDVLEVIAQAGLTMVDLRGGA